MSDTDAPTRKAVPHVERGHKIEYSAPYDAYFCRDCNEWLEEKCKDPECEECAERPARPLL